MTARLDLRTFRFLASEIEEESRGALNSGVVRRWISLDYLETPLQTPPKGRPRLFSGANVLEMLHLHLLSAAGINLDLAAGSFMKALSADARAIIYIPPNRDLSPLAPSLPPKVLQTWIDDEGREYASKEDWEAAKIPDEPLHFVGDDWADVLQRWHEMGYVSARIIWLLPEVQERNFRFVRQLERLARERQAVDPPAPEAAPISRQMEALETKSLFTPEGDDDE